MSPALRLSNDGGPIAERERRRVSGRLIGFGLTQRPFQRLGGGQEPIPGRHGLGEDGHSALGSIIPPRKPDINYFFPMGQTSNPGSGTTNPLLPFGKVWGKTLGSLASGFVPVFSQDSIAVIAARSCSGVK